MSVVLTSSVFLVPSVHATNELGEWYNTILVKLRLRPQQLDNLLIAKQFSNKSGHPELIQALMLQESGAETNVKTNGGCYGPMQIRVSTAMAVVNTNTELRDKHFGNIKVTTNAVINKLKTDITFSVEIVDSLLASSLEKTKDLNRVIYAYNRGERYMLTVKNPGALHYVKSVRDKIQNTTRYIITPITEK
jgi:hypothetical protein